jgi:hypothetical protein
MKLVFTGLIALCTVAATFGNSYACNYRGQCFSWGLGYLNQAVKGLRESRRGGATPFMDGYITALCHAIELAELQQWSADLALAIEKGQEGN